MVLHRRQRRRAEAERIFVEEFESLAATGFMNVEMHLRPMKDVKIKRVRQVVPEIKEMQLTEPEERHLRRAARHAANETSVAATSSI